MFDKFFKAAGILAAVQAPLAGWSDEFKAFYTSGYRCPQCKARLVNALGVSTLKFYLADGTEIPIWQLSGYRAAYAVCPDCGFRFNTKADAVAPPAAAPAPVMLEIVETERREDPFGTDSRLVDNSQSQATVKRTFTVSKDWSREYSVSYEKASVENAGITLGEKDIASISAGCEQTLTKRYSVSQTSSQTYTEEVEIDVPAATKLRIDFQWKKILQCGYVNVRESSGQIVRVPFSAVVGVTFDQAQVEEH
jgi:DNA-directed RNA polymerase subunit RPC12/RpoP